MVDIVKRLHKVAAVAEIIKDNPKIYYDAADAIESLREENENLHLELDMQQATILVPSQKDDRRRIERLDAALKEALDEAAALRAENEKLREALKPFADAVKDECSWKYDINVDDFRAAAEAIRESGDA